MVYLICIVTFTNQYLTERWHQCHISLKVFKHFLCFNQFDLVFGTTFGLLFTLGNMDYVMLMQVLPTAVTPSLYKMPETPVGRLVQLYSGQTKINVNTMVHQVSNNQCMGFVMLPYKMIREIKGEQRWGRDVRIAGIKGG